MSDTSGIERPERAAKIEVVPSQSGEGYFWRLKAANGEIVCTSGAETYEHPTDAKSAAERSFAIARDAFFDVVYREEPEQPES